MRAWLQSLLTTVRRQPVTALIVLALLLAPVVAFKVPAVQRALLALIETMRTGGARGLALYFLVYGLGGALAFPKAPFHVLAGFVYGPVFGALVASPAGTLAATSAFVLGRTVLRNVVRRRVEGNPTWDALGELLRDDGLRAVWLARMTPVIPQNIFSFAAATTPVRYWHFALGTWAGLLPITCFHAYLGSIVESATAIVRGEQSPSLAAKVGSGVIVFASAAGVYAITRFAKRRLAEIIAQREAKDAQTPPPEAAITNDR
ncbi:MAG: VTT domain-containing protein [Polyangiales bacterium]